MSLHSVVLVCSAELFTYTPKSNSSSSSNILHLLQGYATPSPRSTSVVIADSTSGDILSIAQMRLVVLVSVKDCRRKNEQITSRARIEMIKSSLVILQATIGRNATSQSEFELCTQKIVSLAPEMKDPIPPILQDTFKQWVSIFLEGIMCTCHVIYTTALNSRCRKTYNKNIYYPKGLFPHILPVIHFSKEIIFI